MSAKTKTILALTLLTGLTCSALADEEASNQARVVAAESGRCYARSVPGESSGQRGSTAVYAVREAGDNLLYTLPWYSAEIHIHCSPARMDAISVVQMGPWARGRAASAGDLALAFHFNGKLVRQYSTLEIAGRPDNVQATKSHYTIFRDVVGYVPKIDGYLPGGSDSVFVVDTHDGRRLTFEPVTGELLAPRRSY